MLKKSFSLVALGVASSLGMIAPNALFAEKTQVEVVEQGTFSVAIAQSKSALGKWAKADADVLQEFEVFLESLQKGLDDGVLTEEGFFRILDAVSFAAEKHKDQLRRNAKKTPYIIHPIGVANYVMRIGHIYEPDVLVAALLHDTLDGTDTTPKEISDRYGKVVEGYVSEMTENKDLSLKERRKQQIIHAFHQSKNVAIIKLSDKLHNLTTLMKDPPAGWNQDRMDQYFQWAQAVIDNLPVVNASLKEAVHKTIAKYWESQE